MRFLFTCGGTAGHINPALAVAGRLHELMPDSEFLFLGAEGKMEMQLVPREGYKILPLKITNISRERSISSIKHNLDTVRNVLGSEHEAASIIRRFKPDAVIGTGGYVCFPVLSAAARLHIPTAVHESNAVPGLTTRMLADRVDRIMVGFEESRKQYRHPERVVVTGTPVRGEFSSYTQESAKAQMGMSPDEALVVSVWGSLGAAHMNGVIGDMIPLLKGKNEFRLLHAAGSLYYDELCARLAGTAPDYPRYGVEVREYIYDMPRCMAAADLILCRAGASTLSELTFLGKPAVLVPSPNVTNHHQEKNARVLAEAGGARLFLEGEFDAPTLLESISGLLKDRKELRAMSKAMSALAVPDATDRIVEQIMSLIS